jgi:hypothetical protein
MKYPVSLQELRHPRAARRIDRSGEIIELTKHLYDFFQLIRDLMTLRMDRTNLLGA